MHHHLPYHFISTSIQNENAQFWFYAAMEGAQLYENLFAVKKLINFKIIELAS